MRRAYVVYSVWVPLGYKPGDAAHVEFHGLYESREVAKLEAELRHCDWSEVEVVE